MSLGHVPADWQTSCHSCAQVLKEVRSIYKVVCEGVLNLVDKFFEMDRGDALKVRQPHQVTIAS